MTSRIIALPCLLWGWSALAQSPEPAKPATQSPAAQKIGVIQIQSALVGTKEGQRAAADLDAKFSSKKKEFERRQEEIRGLQEKLSRGGTAMADKAKEDLQRTIAQKTTSLNRDMEDAQSEAEQEQQKVLNELGNKMLVVIDKYARDNGYAVILDVSSPNTPVLYASNTVEITQDIIGLYDLNAPASSAPPGAKPSTAMPKPQLPTAPKANPTPPPVKKP